MAISSMACLTVISAVGWASSDLQQKCDEVVSSSKVPGLAAVYFQNGKKIDGCFAGVRAIGTSVAIQEHDQWHLGSDSKAMTAFLIAMAIEDGKLAWDSKPVEVLALMNQANPNFNNVTIEMLATHRAGIPDIGTFPIDQTWLNPEQDMTSVRLNVTSAALKQAPVYPPDSKFQYGNINYIVLGSILEKVHGEEWEKLTTAKLFAPLGMASCGFGPPGAFGESAPSQPWPHLDQNNQIIPLKPSWQVDNPKFLGPAGTVHCSLSDWSKFLNNLVLGKQGKGKLLPSSAFQKLFQAGKDGKYTFGAWGRDQVDWAKDDVFAHDGSNTLNYASAVLVPEHNAIIAAATNSGLARGQGAVHAVIEHIGKILTAISSDR